MRCYYPSYFIVHLESLFVNSPTLIFFLNKQVQAIFKIGNSKDIPEIPNHLSDEGKNFLMLCLQRDPSLRPSAVQLMDHPFVRDQAKIKISNGNIVRDAYPSNPSSSDGCRSTVMFSFFWISFTTHSNVWTVGYRWLPNFFALTSFNLYNFFGGFLVLRIFIFLSFTQEKELETEFLLLFVTDDYQ